MVFGSPYFQVLLGPLNNCKIEKMVEELLQEARKNVS
jgi:hypothetical protein